jgi:hypothetical protein
VKGKWTAAVALGLMLLAFLPALRWRLEVLDTDAVIITPEWERRVLALAILTPLLPASALIFAAVRRTLRRRVVLPLVLLVVLGIAGGGALMTVLRKNFIFADVYLHTEHTRPEELHLYGASFFSCRLKVFAAPPGARTARLVLSDSSHCGEAVHAQWVSDGGVELIGNAH